MTRQTFLRLPGVSRMAGRLALAVLLASLLSACAPGLPLVVVDEAHFQSLKQGSLDGGYKLSAGEGFVLDATGYPFLIPAEAPQVPGPNMIQLSTSDGQVYSHPWDLNLTRYELTGATLVNVDTGQAFPGLVAGQSYLLGVGYLDAGGRFTVLWAAVVDVKPS